MANLNRNTVKKLLKSVLLGVAIGVVLCLPTTLTYANIKPSSPNVVVTVDKRGNMSCVGNMFDNTLWYPGKKADGTIRIKDDFKRFKVTDFDVKMDLKSWKAGYNRELVEASFLKNMKLSLNMKKNLLQTQFFVNNQCLLKFLNREGDKRYHGYHLEDKEQFYLDKSDFVDLDYSLVMDLESGNELQDLTANVGVTITVAEK